MPSFYLTIETSVNATTGASPLLQVIVNGAVVSSASVTAQTGVGSNILLFTIDEDSAAYPASLAFRFSNTSGDVSDVVTIHTVRINGQAITAGDLTATILSRGQTSTVVSTAAHDHLFGQTPPVIATDYGPPTITATGTESQVAGSSGTDIILGSTLDDRVLGYDGDDVISGGDGNDQLYGQVGNDIIAGGAGNDRIFGNEGDDLLYGEDGNDQLYGGTGNDVLNGGDGNDQLFGEAGDDILYGGAGDDVLTGTSGSNRMYGGDGNDRLLGGSGDDIGYGGAGNDQLHGANGADALYGEAGDDLMTGGNGDDYMDGGADNDRMLGDAGNDTMFGGTGNDTMHGGDGNDSVDGNDGNDVLYGGAGADTINGGAGDDIIFGHGLEASAVQTILRNNPGLVYSEALGSFYMFVNSSVTWDTARAAALGATINGVAGHLVNINSAAENQLVYQLGVDNGADNSSGSGGNRIWLGASDVAQDQVWRWADGPEAGLQLSAGATATNGLYANWGSGQPNNSGGAQTYATIWFNGGGDNSTWDDRSPGDTHDYVIEWEIGQFSDDNAADTLYGGNGNDTLYGFGGNDALYGGAGADILYGGAGDDVLYGAGRSNEIALTFPASGPFLSYSGSQDGVGTLTLIDGGNGFILDGNLWKKIAFAYTVTANTVIEFDFKSTLQAEITAIGFETDDNYANDSRRFKIWGDQAGAVGYAAPEATFAYNGSGNWMHYTINVGTYFTGTFSHLTFLNDDDGGGTNGNGWWRYIRIYETGSTDTGSNLLVGGAGNDTLQGGSLTDYLYGDTGNDTINGNEGDDSITGGAGVDIMDGGAGNDSFYLANNDFAAGESITGNSGTDTIVLTESTTINFSLGILATVESLTATAGNNNVTMTAQQWIGFSTGISLTGGTGDVLNIIGSGSISASAVPATLSGIETGNLIGTAGNDTFTLTGAQLNAIIIGSGTIDFLGGTDTLNLTSTSTDLNTLGATDASIQGLESISASGAGGAVTINMSAQTEGINITGGSGGDTLTGARGTGTLSGGGGNDTLTSSSVDTLASQISTILAANSGVVYDSTTGNFYKFVTGNFSWSNANTDATTSLINGVAGHLAHVTSAYENGMLDTLTGSNNFWLGATDTATEGTWRFQGGILNGISFWLGNSGGSVQNFFYEGFPGSEPSGDDYLSFRNGGSWAAVKDNGGNRQDYVIEWEGSQILNPTSSTTLSGGAGTDNLYGSAGQDIFLFETTSWGTNDTIHNYNRAHLDKIDIGDLLTGFTPGSSDVDAFARFTVSGANLLLQVDQNGTTGGASYTTVATLSGMGTSALNVEEMYAAGLLIMT